MKETTDMAWPRVKEGRGGYHQEDVKHASEGKEKKGRHKKRWLENIRHERIQDDKIHGAESKCVRMKTKAGTLLHGGGL